MRYSAKWKSWITQGDAKTCKPCKSNHGKIYGIRETVTPSPPLHNYCRCKIQRLKSILAWEATDKKHNGADWYLKYKGKLPDYYIYIDDAHNLGWEPKLGNLNQIFPGRMIFGGRYKNSNGHLPIKNGREWYEADINYEMGYRNDQRIVYSNDGLVFVTYDHYKTFIEIR